MRDVAFVASETSLHRADAMISPMVWPVLAISQPGVG